MKKVLLLFFCFAIFAANGQVRSVSGRVTSKTDGNALTGVTVLVQGSNASAITNAEGGFTISARQGDVVTFSMLGYEAQTLTLGAATTINVAMEPDTTTIDDVVVIGYGVQKKSVVTAAISSVKAEALETQTQSRIENVLQGKVAGVNIVRNSGQPDAEAKVRIRGIGTTGNSNPLYVIDGMQVGGGIGQINPSDIESIEVLKDAASAAVYGTRGANGVILVTTKKGTKGGVRVTYDFQHGWQNPWKLRSVLNTQQYQELMNEMALNGGHTAPYLNAAGQPDATVAKYKDAAGNPLHFDTNWQKELFNFNAPVQDHQLAVSGANDLANYYVSVGYFNHEGLVGGNYGRSNYDRLSIRSNTTFNLMDHSNKRSFLNKAHLGVNAMYAHTNQKGISANGFMGGFVSSALLLPPNEPLYSFDEEGDKSRLAKGAPAIYSPDGRMYSIMEDYNELVNPLANLQRPAEKNWGDKFISTFWADLQLYKGLTFKSSFGTDFAFWGKTGYTVPYYLSSRDKAQKFRRDDGTMQDDSKVWSDMHRSLEWQVENTLTYSENFGKHGLTVLLGQAARGNQGHELSGASTGLKYPDYPDKISIGNTTTANGSREADGYYKDPYRLASYFGRLSYNYDERYMLEFTLRSDGSSRFGPTNKWATFPSVSVGWNIINERFAHNFSRYKISNLKLRASWGRNGNDNIDNWKYKTTMAGGMNYIFGQSTTPGTGAVIYPGAKPNGFSNPHIRWEQSEQIDVGLDAGFFNGSLNFSIDWYRKTTIGMLREMPTSNYKGDSSPIGNVATMANSGVEIELGYRLVRGEWNFGATFNATYLRNRLINMGTVSGVDYGGYLNFIGNTTQSKKGYPLNYFWGRKTAGIFQTDAEADSYLNKENRKIQPNAKAGDVRFVDVNGDGVINDADNVMIGKFYPDWTYNFSFDVAWKGIDLSMFWQGVAGSDIFDATRRLDLDNVNMPTYMLDRWHGEGTSTKMPRLLRDGDNTNGNWISNDLYIQNGAYLRLKSLQLGYTIPAKWTKKVLISRLRVYFMAENLVTITGYRGFDPEMENGIDSGIYPQPRTLSVGLNLAF